jgi:hypothetical protein
MKKLILTLGIAIAFYFSSFAQWTLPGTDISNTNSGNVGIGLPNPAAKLDIYAAGSGAVLRGNVGGSLMVPAFELHGYNTNASNAGMTISTNDGGTFSEKVRIQSNGNVGIGTTTPAVKLEVLGTTYTANFQNTAASNTPVVSIQQLNAGGNDAAQGLHIDARSVGSALDIFNNAIPLLRVKTNGNVGIGTTNPVTKLDVNGVGNFQGFI